MHAKVTSARVAGFLYLLIIVFGLIAQIFVRDSLVDYQDAATTAKNITASEFRYRFGFVSELLMLACDIGVTTILYLLLKESAKGLSLLSTFFRLTSISILGVVALTHYAALTFLGKTEYLTVFTTDQLNALALLSVRLHGSGYNVSLFFFGIHLIILGFLVRRSGIVPGFLAVLLVIAGLCYDLNSIMWFLFPSYITAIYPMILIPSFVAELMFSIWLLKGIRVAADPARRI